MSYIVELETAVYLTDGDGDPPRTLKTSNATHYQNRGAALIALNKAIKIAQFRKFKNAKILPA